MAQRKTLVFGLTTIVLAGAAWWGWNNFRPAEPATPKKQQQVPVKVAKATLGEIPLLLEIVGRAEAYESVLLKSRIDGQVASVAYVEGQHVKRGDALVQLDPNDFAAKLAQAEANLARSQALQAKSKADVERYVALKAKGFVSEEKINEFRTAEAAAAAAVKADSAAAELARLQLSYATLRAPFDGVVGARLVFPGSAIKTNDTVVAVVNRIQPLYITFSVPEKHLPKLRQSLSNAPITVNVSLPGNKEQSFPATAKFIDNAVDPATGTIQVKAILDNKNEKLTPGQFLNVSLTLEKRQDAVLIPSESVQQGADGNFVYAVKADNTAELRKIVVLATHRGMAAIASGVAADDTVVTDGQLRLTPGAAIKIKSPENAAPQPVAPAASR